MEYESTALPLLKHGGIDKGAEAEAEIDDRPSAPHAHAYMYLPCKLRYM